MDFEEKTVTRTEIFKGKVIELVVDEIELPNQLGRATRELIFHPGGVSVLAITPEDKIIFVKQFRKPLEKMIYEIPAGKLELGENKDLLTAMSRELEEETGYKAGKLEKLYTFYITPGFANEIHHLFFASDLEKLKNPRQGEAEEFLELYEFSFDEVQKLIQTGEIEDAKTLIAVQQWELMRLKAESK
ncbi:MAG: NUDIX hydrolase [Lactovum sp.]